MKAAEKEEKKTSSYKNINDYKNSEPQFGTVMVYHLLAWNAVL